MQAYWVLIILKVSFKYFGWINDMDGIYKNIKESNPKREGKY